MLHLRKGPCALLTQQFLLQQLLCSLAMLHANLCSWPAAGLAAADRSVDPAACPLSAG